MPLSQFTEPQYWPIYIQVGTALVAVAGAYGAVRAKMNGIDRQMEHMETRQAALEEKFDKVQADLGEMKHTLGALEMFVKLEAKRDGD